MADFDAQRVAKGLRAFAQSRLSVGLCHALNNGGNVAKKMCEICGEKPATVPDRERMGRLINRVCSSCHALRLAGDMKRILELHEKRRQANGA